MCPRNGLCVTLLVHRQELHHAVVAWDVTKWVDLVLNQASWGVFHVGQKWSACVYIYILMIAIIVVVIIIMYYYYVLLLLLLLVLLLLLLLCFLLLLYNVLEVSAITNWSLWIIKPMITNAWSAAGGRDWQHADTIWNPLSFFPYRNPLVWHTKFIDEYCTGQLYPSNHPIPSKQSEITKEMLQKSRKLPWTAKGGCAGSTLGMIRGRCHGIR